MEVYVSRKFCIYSLSMKFLCDASEPIQLKKSFIQKSRQLALVSY